jgi:hypothetical protein
VTLSAKALQAASAVAVNLPLVVAHDLHRINTMLPGPATRVGMFFATGSGLIAAQEGVTGVTDAANGSAEVAFGPTPQASLERP